jgi:hypothetical protein
LTNQFVEPDTSERPEAPHAIDDQCRQVLLGFLGRFKKHPEGQLQVWHRAARQADRGADPFEERDLTIDQVDDGGGVDRGADIPLDWAINTL